MLSAPALMVHRCQLRTQNAFHDCHCQGGFFRNTFQLTVGASDKEIQFDLILIEGSFIDVIVWSVEGPIVLSKKIMTSLILLLIIILPLSDCFDHSLVGFNLSD